MRTVIVSHDTSDEIKKLPQGTTDQEGVGIAEVINDFLALVVVCGFGKVVAFLGVVSFHKQYPFDQCIQLVEFR